MRAVRYAGADGGARRAIRASRAGYPDRRGRADGAAPLRDGRSYAIGMSGDR